MKNKQSIEFLVERTIQVLQQGIDLIENLTDPQYGYGRRGDRGTVGTHFRHILDFVFRFLDGFENGKIDYNNRIRDPFTETNKDLAIEQFVKAIVRLQNLPPETAHRPLLTHLEPGNFEDEAGAWCRTSVLRELEFLQSHTLHHFALIAAKLKTLNIAVSKEFGVAPSTLDYWEREKPLEKSMHQG